jgi:hypothetical protein
LIAKTSFSSSLPSLLFFLLSVLEEILTRHSIESCPMAPVGSGRELCCFLYKSSHQETRQSLKDLEAASFLPPLWPGHLGRPVLGGAAPWSR